VVWLLFQAKIFEMGRYFSSFATQDVELKKYKKVEYLYLLQGVNGIGKFPFYFI